MNVQAWTNAVIDYAKQLHADGISAGVAARTLTDRFGRTFSRNAVIGKWKRLGMPRRQVSVVLKRGEGHRSNPSPRIATVARVPKLKGLQATVTSLDPQEIPVGQRKSLMQLGRHDCRFPYGDPGQDNFFFCGADNRDGLASYCPGHALIAFTRNERSNADRLRCVAAIRRVGQERMDAAVRGAA